MEKQPISSYFWFGTCVRYLSDATEGFSIKGDGGVLFNLERFFEEIERLDLQVSRRATQNPYIKLDAFRDELTALDDNAVLSKEQAEKLKEKIHSMRPTVESELEGLDAFVVTEKRLSAHKLLDDAPNMFTPGVFNNLPEIARYDFNEAGKCIAFGRPTAGAFHLLRGTESVLRGFYCALIKSKRVSPLLWGNIVSDLRKRKKTCKHKTLCNNLDSIRLSYRNPTQHPEKIYDIHEVQDLWPLCVEVTNRMSNILMKA